MSLWKDEIIGYLTGSSLGISQERLDWDGISQLLQEWNMISVQERCDMQDAMAEIISEDKNENTDWGVMVDLIYFISTQQIWDDKIHSGVSSLKITEIPQEWQERVAYVLDVYNGYYLLQKKVK